MTALCALGTCLIVYRGNRDAEDIALNASGALAFVVAFVPTRVPSATGVTCSASNVPGPGQLEDAVNNNMVAMIVASFVAIVVAMVASMVVFGLLYALVSGWRHGVLWIETALLIEFLIFWVVQTVELWNETRREAPSPS